jgi:hypothetical protein
LALVDSIVDAPRLALLFVLALCVGASLPAQRRRQK